MHPVILAVHNILRWVVFFAGLVAVVDAFWGWFGSRAWTQVQRRLGLIFTISIDIQLLLGLLLYFFFSPLTRAALQNFSAAMGSPELRFFGLEHAFFMILAVVFAHLGSILPRKAQTDRGRFKRAAIFFGLAMIVILSGMPWGRPLFPGL